MNKREFVGEEHYKYCVQEYDKAREFLKSCGKPEDWFDRFMISFNKETCKHFAGYKA